MRSPAHYIVGASIFFLNFLINLDSSLSAASKPKFCINGYGNFEHTPARRWWGVGASKLTRDPSPGALRLLPLPGPVSNISAKVDLSSLGWTLSTAVYLTAIEADLAVHENSRYSRGSSYSAFSAGFSLSFLVSFVPTPS